jgi:hypothetical protein
MTLFGRQPVPPFDWANAQPVERLRQQWSFMYSSIIQVAIVGIYFCLLWTFLPTSATLPTFHFITPTHIALSSTGPIPRVSTSLYVFACTVGAASGSVLLGIVIKTVNGLKLIVAGSFVMFVCMIPLLLGSITAAADHKWQGATIAGFYAIFCGKFFHIFQAILRRWRFLTTFTN